MSSEPEYQPWLQRRKRIVSTIGGWRMGEGVYSHGHNVTGELMGNISYMQMHVLNVTGRLVHRDIADWIEGVFIGLSWPDARIWCNHVGALAGSMGTTPIAAMAAGMVASDSAMYGARTLRDGMKFIIGAMQLSKEGASPERIVLEEIRRNRGQTAIMGYARPLASGDERVDAMLEFMKKRQMPFGEHVQLALSIEQYLLTNYNESLNVGGLMSAFMADNAFDAEQTYQIYAACVMSGVVACYAEAERDLPERFLPMRCDDVEYQGAPPRELPARFFTK
jgi:hypothetical protein